ncbi:hypothetical protein ABK040_001082, partial [Willaertia magna]
MCFTQRLLNRENNDSKVVIRLTASNSAIKDNLIKIKWLKVNDLGKEKPSLKIHSRNILNPKAIIQGIYNAWDRIVEEGNSPKEIRYNYMVNVSNFDIANVLYGQFIVVEGNSFKIENPLDRTLTKQNNDNLSNNKTKDNMVNQIIDETEVNNSSISTQDNSSDKLNPNHNYQPNNPSTLSLELNINVILSKLTESNAQLCSTVNNLAANMDTLHKEIRSIANRVDAFECERKRTRDIISEDYPMKT